MVQTNQMKKKNREGPRYHTAKATDKEALHITGLCERGLMYIQIGCGNRIYITWERRRITKMILTLSMATVFLLSMYGKMFIVMISSYCLWRFNVHDSCSINIMYSMLWHWLHSLHCGAFVLDFDTSVFNLYELVQSAWLIRPLKSSKKCKIMQHSKQLRPVSNINFSSVSS